MRALADMALEQIRAIEGMCDFFEIAAVRNTIKEIVPATLPPDVAALVNIPTWVGLGTVGLWAALDGLAYRAELKPAFKCTCGIRCMRALFQRYAEGAAADSLGELDDLRHLYAHNFAGDVDETYLKHVKRHVLSRPVMLTCGAYFNGHKVQLDLTHLRAYSGTVRSVLEKFR